MNSESQNARAKKTHLPHMLKLIRTLYAYQLINQQMASQNHVNQ